MSKNNIEAKTKLVDDMFHAWLISHGMACDNEGKIHYRDKEGVLGGTVPADEFRLLLEDPDHGLAAKAKQMMPDIEFTLFWTPPELQEYAEQQVTNEGRKQSSK